MQLLFFNLKITFKIMTQEIHNKIKAKTLEMPCSGHILYILSILYLTVIGNYYSKKDCNEHEKKEQHTG